MDLSLKASQIPNRCDEINLEVLLDSGAYSMDDLISSRFSVSDYETGSTYLDSNFESGIIVGDDNGTEINEFSFNTTNANTILIYEHNDVDTAPTADLSFLVEGRFIFLDGGVFEITNVATSSSAITLTVSTMPEGIYQDYLRNIDGTNPFDTLGTLYLLEEDSATSQFYPNEFDNNSIIITPQILDKETLKDGIYVFTLNLKFHNVSINDGEITEISFTNLFYSICRTRKCIQTAISNMVNERMSDYRANKISLFNDVRNKIQLAYMSLQAGIFSFEVGKFNDSIKQQKFAYKICRNCSPKK